MTTENNIEQLLAEIRELRIEIKEMKETTSRMDGHIDFVENVFNLIRVPFFSLMNTVNSFIPSSIEHKEEEHSDWNYITDY